MTGPIIPINRAADARRWLEAANGDPDQAGALWAADLRTRANAGDELAAITLQAAIVEHLTDRFEAAARAAAAAGITNHDQLVDYMTDVTMALLEEASGPA